MSDLEEGIDMVHRTVGDLREGAGRLKLPRAERELRIVQEHLRAAADIAADELVAKKVREGLA